MIKKLLPGLLLFVSWSCTLNKPITTNPEATVHRDTIETKSLSIQPPYQKTPPLIWKLVHTRLDLGLAIPRQEVSGTAILTLHPYFYKQQHVGLDAKAFTIEKIEVQDNDSLLELPFDYDGRRIEMDLHREYTSKDTLELHIMYTAHPTEVKSKSGKAIQASQGMYFIDPDGTIENKPTQVWTQGETDFSSCWFPTLDEPNQKTTQEIAIRVPENMVSLSNGQRVFSTLNGDGTRTDYWEQSLPHSPYLAMLAVGDFAVVQDTWRDKEVSYYVEQEYKADAQAIFGNTPEMIEFYSNILGVDFPWDKYSQVIVRDFVSGAMENTSATIHGEFVQLHRRELIDHPQDDIIAHELFHQWFGDLVSCESWANLPLNEAFATYGEYLWKEHKYGKDAADHHLYNNLNSYLAESRYKQVDWVRFNYEEKDHMFDNHSYSKGARILHMLRTYMGDEAFFEALNRYLIRYEGGSAEMHQLRLIVEEVTGEDYNWFFDQWAFSKGHPKLEITSVYDSVNQDLKLVVTQTQDLETTPLYQLPFSVELHLGDEKRRYELWVKDEVNEYNIRIEQQPDFVDFDSERYLLAEKVEEKSEAEWTWQYRHCKPFVARLEAIRAIAHLDSISYIGNEVLIEALDDPYYYIRLMAVNTSDNLERVDEQVAEKRLLEMAFADPHPKVRAAALSRYIRDFEPENKWELIAKSMADSSYHVLISSLTLSSTMDTNAALVMAEKLENENSAQVWMAVTDIYSRLGNAEKANWFESLNPRLSGYSKSGYLRSYQGFVTRLWQPEITRNFLTTAEGISKDANMVWVKMAATASVTKIYEKTAGEITVIDQQIEDLEDNATRLNELRTEREKWQKELDFTNAVVERIRKAQSDPQVLNLLPQD
ncbi:M1 family metallopeptidase [bacterium SCSIO 12741]|nr:M1 family metallopeptidase [bacterium SCSIO 12741]